MLKIGQSQVDTAPLFPEALLKLEAFLVKNGLLDATTGRRLVRFCWCSDGPFDIRDFVVKQCFMSQVGVNSLIYRPYLVNTSRSDKNASLGSGRCTGRQIFSPSMVINLRCMSFMTTSKLSKLILSLTESTCCKPKAGLLEDPCSAGGPRPTGF